MFFFSLNNNDKYVEYWLSDLNPKSQYTIIDYFYFSLKEEIQPQASGYATMNCYDFTPRHCNANPW